MMGFTVKCNDCGTEQTYENGGRLYATNVDIDVRLTGSYEPNFDYVSIYCHNRECNQSIELK